MTTFTEHLTQHHIPQHYIRAVQNLNDNPCSTDEYKARLNQLGAEDFNASDDEIRYTYMYAIQLGLQSGIVDVNIANDRARMFLKKNPWVAVQSATSDTIVDKNTGIVRKKKGWKKVAAIEIAKELGLEKRSEIIARFQSELDMSVPGATTYYYIAKKEIQG